MARKIVFVHTVPTLVGLFNDLSKELLPGNLEIYHVADEMLLKIVLAQGSLSPFIFRRVAEHVVSSAEMGAALVQVTCSSISPCVDAVRPFVSIPVLKIDEPMVDKALSIGAHIGVAATAPTTLKPTTELIYERASALGKTVKVDSVLCEGAFVALQSGKPELHDTIVRDRLKALLETCDVVLLAQASMARVAATIPTAEQRVPIISSPRLAVEHLGSVLTNLA